MKQNSAARPTCNKCFISIYTYIHIHIKYKVVDFIQNSRNIDLLEQITF